MGNISRNSFLEKLYSGCEGQIELRALPSKKRLFCPIYSPEIVDRFISNHSSNNLYFAVCTRNGGGKKDHIIDIPAAWIDIDFKTTPRKQSEKRLSEFPCPPTFIIETGGGLHVYWQLKEPLHKQDIPDFEGLLKQLAIYFKADRSATDASRILRIPDSTNHKYDPPPTVKVIAYNDLHYEPADLELYLPPLKVPGEATTELSDHTKKLLSDKIPECIAYILTEMPKTDDVVNFNRLVLLVTSYFKMAGWDQEHVWNQVRDFVLGYKHSATYSDEKKRESHFWTIWNYVKNNPGYDFHCGFVKGLRLPGNAFDCSQCIDEMHEGLINESHFEEKGQTDTQQHAQSSEPKKKLDDAILPAKDFTNLDLPVKSVILDPWLTEQNIILISGWRGVGKSWFALSLCDAVAKGENFGPWETKTAIPTLYCDAEMISIDVKDRLRDLNPNLSWTQPFFIYSDAYASNLGIPRANALNNEWRKAMTRILLTKNIGLWVLDNLTASTPGTDENSQREWAPINDWLLSLRFKGISTIVVHHVNKLGDQRGTSAREDNIDTSIMLKRPPKYRQEQGCRFVLHFSKSRISTRKFKLIADTEFKLTRDPENRLIWTWGNAKEQTKTEVLRMLDEGISYEIISEDLGISKSRISQIKKRAISDGFLTSKGKFTQEGFIHFA